KLCAQLNDTTRLRYVTYNFDNYDASVTTSYSANGKIVVRGVTLLDYTIGGPDFRPDLFGLPTNGACSTSPATGACGTRIPTCPGNGTFSCLAEPLSGIQALLPTDPDTKFSNGNVLSEFIYTPGMVQTSTINVQDALAMAFDITPFNETPNALGADQPLFDANN